MLGCRMTLGDPKNFWLDGFLPPWKKFKVMFYDDILLILEEMNMKTFLWAGESIMCPDRCSFSVSGVWVLFPSLLSYEIWEQALDILIYKNEMKERVTIWRKIFVRKKLVWWRNSWIRVSGWGALEKSCCLMRSVEWARAKVRRICPSLIRPGQGTLGSKDRNVKARVFGRGLSSSAQVILNNIPISL